MLQTSTRNATLDDIPILAIFERELARVNYPDAPIEDLDYHSGKLYKALARAPEGMVVLVNAETEEIVAWLWAVTKRTLATGESYGVLQSIYVRPQARRSGLGTMLAQYALRYFEGLGIRRIVAKAHADNTPGMGLLAKAGFKSTHISYEQLLPEPDGR